MNIPTPSIHCIHYLKQTSGQIKGSLRWFLITLATFAGFLLSAGTATAGISFNYTLSGSCTTSAGVYDSSNRLVKTLWSKRVFASGTTAQDTWDGTKDDGTTAPDGNYQIKLLSNNLNYVWEGVIGNTDTSFTSVTTGGDTVWHGYDIINDMAISGTSMFIANGYCEGNANAYRASTLTPNTPKQMVFNGNVVDAATQFEYTATDGTWTYFVSAECGFNNASFIVAYKVSDNTAATFTTGTSFKPMSWSNTYNSVIDLTLSGTNNTSINPPTGLAVQKTGNILAVPHAGANEVRLFHKTGGQLLGSIAISAPGKVAFSPLNDDLWVITGTTVQRFTAAQVASISATGTQLSAAATISGLIGPVAVAVDPRAGIDLVLVADSGTSQQVKGFTSAGAVASGWSVPLGTAGGYNATNGNEVTNTKFWFGNAGTSAACYIAIQDDGSFWVGDLGNWRNLHFSSALAYINQIAYLPANYVVTCDPNAPTRVFGAGWLEYQVDYTKPLLPGDPAATGGNNSWKLVRNWQAGVSSLYLGGVTSHGINTVATLSNGRTYGLVLSNTNSQSAVVELPSTGLMRFTGISVPTSTTLYPNGDLRSSGTSNGMQTVWNQTLTGFDASGNPLWSGSTVITTASAGSKDAWYRRKWCGATGPQFPITDCNIVISFDQSVTVGSGTNVNTGFHLGGMAVSGTAWAWQTSTSGTTVDFYTPSQQNGTYDIGDGTNYGGNTVHVNGRNVIYGFHGEGWKSKQANQFVHYYDDGLFVGQFGVPNGNTSAIAGVAGNSFTSIIVKTSGTSYFYHSDESNHGGIHRWRLDGADGIAEMGASGTLSGTNASTITLAALPATPTGLSAGTSNGEVALFWKAVSGATSYNIYRGTFGCGEGVTPIYTGVTGATKLDTGLTNGTSYYYKVAAVNSAGISGFSSEISAIPALQGSIYEAESTGTASMYKMYVRNDSYASNGQYMMGLGGNSGAWITMNNIDGGSGGSKTLTIRYYAPHVVTKSVYVNGTKVGGVAQSFPFTASALGTNDAWGFVSIPITLNAGTSNTISVKDDNGDPYWLHLDFFSVK